MTRLSHAWWSTFLLTATFACHGDSQSTFDVAEAIDGSASWSPVCPNSVPALGSECAGTGQQCEYGTSAWNPACNSIITCTGNVWTQGAPGVSNCTEPQPNPVECPTTYQYSRATCPQAGLLCEYPEGDECACQALDGGSQWTCYPEPGCPTTRPRLGSPCTAEPPTCSYPASSGCGYSQVCGDGVWRAAPIGCATPSRTPSGGR
jgi:hypothetical protein